MALTLGTTPIDTIGGGGNEVGSVSAGRSLIWHRNDQQQLMHRDPLDPERIPDNGSFTPAPRFVPHPNWPHTIVEPGGIAIVAPRHSDLPTRVYFGIMKSNDSGKTAHYTLRIMRNNGDGGVHVVLAQSPESIVPPRTVAVMEYISAEITDIRAGQHFYATVKARATGLGTGYRWIEYCFGEICYDPAIKPPVLIQE